MKTLTVWHFAADKLRDGSPLPKAGDILPTIAKPVLCVRGWHGSLRLIDALCYAPGPNLAARELRGRILTQEDKACASHALQLTSYRDVSAGLIRFARRVALCALRVDAAADAADAAYAAYAAAYAAADAADAAAYAADAAAAYAAARERMNGWLIEELTA